MGVVSLETTRNARGIVNVASVPMRSPFRYPGGKTWLVPWIRQWLQSYETPPACLIEPFAGGAIVALTAVFEDLVETATLVELDSHVASVWDTIIYGDAEWLANEIASFEFSEDSVREALARRCRSTREEAFSTLLRNRVSRGGIMAPGAGLIKDGENGRGMASRWYPGTIRKRIMDIKGVRDRLMFAKCDGVGYMQHTVDQSDVVYFVDPPYTIAGRRLYAHSEVNHERLFEIAGMLRGDFLMTYDNVAPITLLAKRHGFDTREVAMKNTHHAKKTELLISRDLRWMDP